MADAGNNGIEIQSPSDVLNKLSVALTQISRGDPLVSLRNELQTEFKGIGQRFHAIDEATKLQHEDQVRIPTQIDRAVTALRDLLEQTIKTHIATLHGELNSISEVTDERFRSIQTQFTLLKQATEQLDIANKTAIAAALQAQKESAGETQKTSQAAIAKSELSTSEAIKALTAAFNSTIAEVRNNLNDLKGRMDRGEGKSAAADPALLLQMSELSRDVRLLSQARSEGIGAREQHVDQRANTGQTIAMAVMFSGIVSIAIAIAALLIHRAGG
jgi:hypothetical protein